MRRGIGMEVTTEATTDVAMDKAGMSTGGTVNPPVSLPVNPPVNLPENLTVNLPENLTVNLPENLTVTAKKIYDLLREDGKYTCDRLADAVRVSIRSLVDAELIRRVGPDKTGYWEFVK